MQPLVVKFTDARIDDNVEVSLTPTVSSKPRPVQVSDDDPPLSKLKRESADGEPITKTLNFKTWS